MILAFVAAAWAKDPPAPRDMYGNGTTVAIVGAIATPVAVAAVSTDDRGAQIAGFVAGIAGPPMLAFGSARAAHGVSEMGVHVTPVGSTLCGLGWVAANVLAFTARDSIAPVVVFGGAYLAGIGQVVANAVAYGKTDHDYASAPPRRTLHVALDPSRRGLVLSGTF